MKKLTFLAFFIIFSFILFSQTKALTYIDSCQELNQEGETYVLTQDIIGNNTCINITANNVTLDCSNYQIIGNYTGYGIIASGLSGIKIYNCRIKNWEQGIYFSGSGIVENCTFDYNYVNQIGGNINITNIVSSNNRDIGLNLFSGVVRIKNAYFKNNSVGLQFSENFHTYYAKNITSVNNTNSGIIIANWRGYLELEDVIAINNSNGIYFTYEPYSILKNIYCSNNNVGLKFYWIFNYKKIENTILENNSDDVSIGTLDYGPFCENNNEFINFTAYGKPSYFLRSGNSNLDSGIIIACVNNANFSNVSLFKGWFYTFKSNYTDIKIKNVAWFNGNNNTYQKNNLFNCSGFYIDGSNNTIKDFLVHNCTNGISIAGDNNKIENIESKMCYNGITITGGYNNITNISAFNNSNIGIYLRIHRSIASNLVAKNNYYGIVGGGFEYFNRPSISYSNLTNLYLENNYFGLYFYARWISSNEFNRIYNSTFKNNQYGFYMITQMFESANNMFNIIEDCFFENNYYGISFAYGHYYWFPPYGCSRHNILKNSKFQGNYIGVFVECENNTIYNNLLNNTINAYIQYERYWANFSNYFNTTKQLGARIYSNGLYIGGNYWTNSTGNGYSDICVDENTDGFCDSPYIVLDEYSVDYLPLSNKYFALSFENPVEYPPEPAFSNQPLYMFNITVCDRDGENYISTVLFEWQGVNSTVNDYEVLNDTCRVYYVSKTLLPAGIYSYSWYANDTFNLWLRYDDSYEVISPEFNIIYPQNQTYYGTIDFKFYVIGLETFELKAFLNNELIYENSSYVNNTLIEFSRLLPANTYNFTVYSLGNSKEIIFTSFGYCGDNICSGTEDVASCFKDCGGTARKFLLSTTIPILAVIALFSLISILYISPQSKPVEEVIKIAIIILIIVIAISFILNL